MSHTNMPREVMRTMTTVVTGAISVFWFASIGFHLHTLHVAKDAWYEFPLQMTILYGSLLLGALVGYGFWKLTERFK